MLSLLLVGLLPLLSLALPDVHLRHEYTLTTKKPYFYLDNHSLPFYDYFGNAVPSHDHIRLAQSSFQMKGALWSKEKNKHSQWMVQLKFRIEGSGIVGGHGMVLWYTRQRGVSTHLLNEKYPTAIDPTGAQLGPFYGSQDRWDGLGVVMDTYDEALGRRQNPIIFGLLNGEDRDFAHIPDPSTKSIGSCFKDYRNQPYPATLRVYFMDDTLQVWVDAGEQGHAFELCFSAKVKLPSDYYFGVSASSSDMPDNHDVVSIDVYEVNPKLTTEQSHYQHKTDQHFEDIHRKVEEARENMEKVHEQHVGHDQNSNHLLQIQKTQYDILTKLEYLASMPSSSQAGGSSGGCSYTKELSEIRGGLDHLSKEMDTVQQVLQETARFIAHSSRANSKDSSNGDFLRALDDLSVKMNNIHSNTETVIRHTESAAKLKDEFHPSPLMLLGGFLFSQVVVMYVYNAWKSRTEEKSKKFI